MSKIFLDNRTSRLVALGIAAVLAVGVLALALPNSEPAPGLAATAPQPATIPDADIVSPQRRSVARRFETNATLEAFETADLYAKISGYLSEVRLDIGDPVTKGQVLAMISVPEMEKELAEAEATIAARRADAALQQVTLERQQKLIQIQGTSQQLYDEAKSKAGVADAQVKLAIASAERIRTMLGYSRIVAPFDGVVTERKVNRGDFVQAPTVGRAISLFTVQRVDVVRVFGNVPESDVARLKVGLPATIKLYGLEGKTVAGTVTRFAGRLDPETRNMRTEIDVPNPDGILYPGMYAQVSLETELHPDVLTLPVTAVGTEPAGRFVFVLREGRTTRQPVQVGLTEGTVIEIISGITEQDRILRVVQGAPPVGTQVRTPSGP